MTRRASHHERVSRAYIVVVAMCIALASCEPLCVAKGKIVGVDAAVGSHCSVRLHDVVGEPHASGMPCRRPDALEGTPDRWVVNVGEEFACRTIPRLKGTRLEVSVSCDGYEPYRSQPFEWKVDGFTCARLDLGMVQLRRSAGGATPGAE
jgi:hypothetical protein